MQMQVVVLLTHHGTGKQMEQVQQIQMEQHLQQFQQTLRQVLVLLNIQEQEVKQL